jgi:hypothetical protein
MSMTPIANRAWLAMRRRLRYARLISDPGVAMRALILSAAFASVLMGTACTVVTPSPAVVAPVATQAPTTQQTAYCREYTSTAIVDGQPQQTVGTACQQPDGRWQIVDAAPPSGTPSAAPQATVVYPAYYYPYPYYPYPYYPYWGPSFGVGVGFRFGGHHHH